MLTGFLAGGEIPAFTKPQHHIEKAVSWPAVCDCVVLAANGAHADAAERENAGLHGRLADDIDDLGHVEAFIEIGGIFDREMRHGDHSRSAAEPQPPPFTKVPTRA